MTMNSRFAQTATLSLLSACLLAGTTVTAAHAQTAAAEAQNSASSIAPIQGLYDALKSAQTTGKTAQQRAGMIAPAIDRAFDLEAILRRSVGVRYNSLSPDDRTRLLGSFRQFTIARYASSFKPGANAVFVIKPQTRSNPTGGQIVDTTIGASADNGTPIDYIMTSGASGWRVTDILLDAHISQVAAQRADFGGALSKGGASGLADLLDRKTTQFLHD
ncbi:Toluene tolerance, Ttg2 [Gluconobacter japonicus]|nr:Toluene tolerance, Ttg2 [Gluconobacter japonicus]